jgi:hypothetical protein
MMKKSVESSADQQYPVFSQAPLYIRESLVFPYAEGLAFQDAVFRKLGKDAFAEVFVHPPKSSGQILHPERYLEHAGLAIPKPPAAPAAHDFRKLADGTLGEFDFRVLIEQYTSAEEGASLAEHLVGGSYELLEHKREKFPVLAVASAWDSPEIGPEILRAIRPRDAWQMEEAGDYASESPEEGGRPRRLGIFSGVVGWGDGEPDRGVEDAAAIRPIAINESTAATGTPRPTSN